MFKIKKLKVDTFCSCEEPADEASAIHNQIIMSDIQRGGNIARRNEFEISFILTHLEIWIMGVMKLFTEFEKMQRRSSDDVTDFT